MDLVAHARTHGARLPGQRLVVVLGRLPNDIPQGLREVSDVLAGAGGDLQSLQGSVGAHAAPEHRQDGLLVPLRSRRAQHRAKARIQLSSSAAQRTQPLQQEKNVSPG